MLFFFNKNLVFAMAQFWFGLFNGFSGQTFYDSAYLTMFNAVVTAIAICAFAISNQDINFNDPKTKPALDFFLPLLYQESRDHGMFTRGKFFLWMLLSMIQSAIIYFMVSLVFATSLFKAGNN